MKITEFKISISALQDLEENFDYFSLRNLAYATELYTKIFDKFDLLQRE